MDHQMTATSLDFSLRLNLLALRKISWYRVSAGHRSESSQHSPAKSHWLMPSHQLLHVHCTETELHGKMESQAHSLLKEKKANLVRWWLSCCRPDVNNLALLDRLRQETYAEIGRLNWSNRDRGSFSLTETSSTESNSGAAPTARLALAQKLWIQTRYEANYHAHAQSGN